MKTEELSAEEAAEAWGQKKRVEACPLGSDDWRRIAAIGESADDARFFNARVFYRDFKFRLAPEPPAKKLRPWEFIEVPVGALTRPIIDGGDVLMIAGKFSTGVLIAGDRGVYPFPDLLRLREHSLDGGKTWLPCGVEVSK